MNIIQLGKISQFNQFLLDNECTMTFLVLFEILIEGILTRSNLMVVHIYDFYLFLKSVKSLYPALDGIWFYILPLSIYTRLCLSLIIKFLYRSIGLNVDFYFPDFRIVNISYHLIIFQLLYQDLYQFIYSSNN